MKKNILYGLIIAAIAVLGGFSAGRYSGTVKVSDPQNTPAPSATPLAPVLPPNNAGALNTTPASVPQKPPGTAPKISRMQLTGCVATPNIVTIKLGTYFAMDNLDSTSRKVSVDSQVFFIQPKEYVTPMALHVGTHSVECDGVGIASLVVKP